MSGGERTRDGHDEGHAAEEINNTGERAADGMTHAVAGTLVVEARGGSHAAWSRLVEQFAPTVVAIALRHGLSGSDVDDVHQTVWLRLAENLKMIREPDRIAGWLASTTRNEAMRLSARSRRTMPLVEDDELPASEDEDPEARVIRRESGVLVAQAFAMLEDRCRTLLTATVVEKHAYAAVAADLDIPIGSIGANRKRCLQKLRAFLGRLGALT